MKLYIMRHGMTYQSKNNVAYTPENWKTSPILPEGIPAIEKQAQYLKGITTDANYTSPIERCIQTVEIVSEISGKVFLPNDLLTEYAEWEETFDSLRERGQKFIEYLSQQQIEAASICTHGGVISALKYLLVYGKYEPANLTDYPLPGIITVIETSQFDSLLPSIVTPLSAPKGYLTGGKIEEINFNI